MSDFDSVPILDYNDIKINKTKFLEELRHAIVHVGFLYWRNVPIPADLLSSVKRFTREFFELPKEKKLQLEMWRSPCFLGYSNQGNELTKGLKDNREGLDLGTEVPALWREGEPEWYKIQGPNQWPEENWLPGFRDTFERYIEVLTGFSFELTSLIAEALYLTPNAFEVFYGDHSRLQHRMKIIKYPAVDELEPGASNQGVGPHYDGWLTLLLQGDDLPGLQAQSPHSGKWVDVTPIPDTLVVNLGKGMEHVTQGVAIATTHQVLNPPPGRGPRYSIPFFPRISIDAKLSEPGFKVPPEALALRDARGGIPVVTDSINYKELDKPFGQATVLTRIRAHQDVGRIHYPESMKAIGL
ncbi:Clavaminate synthase-like protein [Meredithblackwellia eburnea MCA 4105]